MESPVVLDKPPEYHGKIDERGFPFDEEESDAWSSLAARHPDIAARLRQRPATWARKRRPSSQDATDDFGDTFGGFDRFPFDDIPAEFRDSFPSHWGRRFEEAQPGHAHAQPPQQQPQPAPQSPQPQQASASTQTSAAPPHAPHLPQYGLRNTVDLGRRSAADPSVDADERGPRSMSAPPEARAPAMNPSRQPEPGPQPAAGTVRHIPIFVEGRDEPVINKSVDHGAHFGETKPAPPPQPHVDRDAYFADDGPPSFHHPPNFSRAFGAPFGKGFRQGPQPFTQQKAYPQTAFARGASPQRSQSPKRPQPEEQFAKAHHEPRGQPAPHPQQHQQQQQHHPQVPPQQHQPPPQQPHAPSPPPKQQPASNDPITVILAIQTDVLNLMSEVENFTGTKKDKKYIYLDEMLTRNLIRLDNIETDGKENIRQARREAIKCIEKCIAVLEAKAESNSNPPAAAPAQEADMPPQAAADPAANGDMHEDTKEATTDARETEDKEQQPAEPENKIEAKPEEKETPQPPDTRPVENRAVLVENKTVQETDKKSPKKKVVKKRDKSEDNTPKDSNKEESDSKEKLESMQVDDKGDQVDSQKMEVDGASASQ